MTSMPFTVSMVVLIGAFSYGSAAFPEVRGRAAGKTACAALYAVQADAVRRLVRSVLGAITQRDLLLRGVLRCGSADQRLDDLRVGLVCAGSDIPLLSVPGLDAATVRAFVVD